MMETTAMFMIIHTHVLSITIVEKGTKKIDTKSDQAA